MNQFQKMAQSPPKCDICGEPMVAFYGNGFDNDRMCCVDRHRCGAEIVFPTSTMPPDAPAAPGNRSES